MALLGLDSFDNYTTLDHKGWTNGANASIQSTSGRFGTAGLRVTQSGSIEKIISGAAFATIIVGFSFKLTQLPSAASADFMRFNDGGTCHVGLEITNGGLCRFTRAGTGGTVLGTGTKQILPNIENYFEVKLTINDTTGVAELKVNGVADITLSSQDTRNGANSTLDRIIPWISNFVSGTQGHYDDLYICDTSGGTNNTYLGDLRVESRLPDGNGNASQFVGSDGNSTDNYLLVDETAPNSDTDYVESSTVNDKDTYTFQNLTPTTGSVVGLQINQFAKKTDAGARTIRSVARFSATETESADKTLPTTYTYLSDIRETKPGGGAWSISDFNATEFGHKVTA